MDGIIRKRDLVITLLTLTPVVGALVYRKSKQHYASKLIKDAK